jgi:glycosyltransferase involved in cell wall biosynthesis
VLTIPPYHLLATGLRRSVGRLPYLRRLDLEPWAHRRFDREVGRRLLRLPEVEVVHAFEGSALATLQAARSVGVRTVLDVPSAHERYMAVEGGSPQPRIAKERLLADVLLAPSDFVVACLAEAGIPMSRIVKVPYGVDPSVFRRDRALRGDDLFRAVFVGRIGRRKGVSYLLEAWRRLALSRAELLLVGEADEEGRRLLERYKGCYRYLGPCPKHEVQRFFQQSDVFVFPSLAEGSALVTYEALASELPIITTPNSGSVARDGIDGFLVPAGDVDAIAERLALLHAEPAVRRAMGARGRDLIEQHYTWRHYRRRIRQLHCRILGVEPAGSAPTGTGGRS